MYCTEHENMETVLWFSRFPPLVTPHEEMLEQQLYGGVEVTGSLLGPLLVGGIPQVPHLLGQTSPDCLDEVLLEMAWHPVNHLQVALEYSTLEVSFEPSKRKITTRLD